MAIFVQKFESADRVVLIRQFKIEEMKLQNPDTFGHAACAGIVMARNTLFSGCSGNAKLLLKMVCGDVKQ
jgi:hypothetical protein